MTFSLRSTFFLSASSTLFPVMVLLAACFSKPLVLQFPFPAHFQTEPVVLSSSYKSQYFSFRSHAPTFSWMTTCATPAMLGWVWRPRRRMAPGFVGCGTGCGLPFLGQLLCATFIDSLCPCYWSPHCQICSWLCLIKSVNCCPHWSVCCILPGAHLLADMWDRFSGSTLYALFVTSLVRHKVLRNVLDGLSCVLSWCVSIPVHPALVSFNSVTVIDQLTRSIFVCFGVIPNGLRQISFSA